MLQLLLFGLLQAGAPNQPTRYDLQGIYDEISQATLQFVTETDVDQFHAVMCTPDWVFIDVSGMRHDWSQVRPQVVAALNNAPDAMVQMIQKLSVTPEGVTAVVQMTVGRTVVDQEGRYGPKGASHLIAETTIFHDAWVMIAGGWKQTSREQTTQPRVQVDKSTYM